MATIAQIQIAVADHYGVAVQELVGADRHKSIVFARQVAYLLCRRHANASYPEIGLAFDGRDHTTIMSGCKAAAQKANRDPRLMTHIIELERRIVGDFGAEERVEALEMCA